MEEYSAIVKVIKSNRITLPKEIVELANIKEGDFIEISIKRKLKKE